MPDNANYTKVYSGTYDSGSHEFIVDTEYSSPTHVSEYDAGYDGESVVGDTINWNLAASSEVRYHGATGGGVILSSNGDYFLVTDTAGLTGTLAVDLDAYHFCYLAGTAIRTPDGEREVETLAIGDLVCTHDGRQVPVRWIGRQVCDARIARLTGGLPVRIRAGALGTDALGASVPARDLRVSPDHALLVDGLLIHARALINGTSIVSVGGDELAEVAYYHVETADHEIIIADGAPAETFIDNASRARFDNHAEWLALHPTAPAMRELPLGRVKLARQVPKRIAVRLADIAAGLPAPVARVA